MVDIVTEKAIKLVNKISDTSGSVSTKATKKLRLQWSLVDFKLCQKLYQSDLVENLSTTRVLGNQKIINIEDIYTDVYVFDRLSALRRYNGDLQNVDSKTDPLFYNQERLSALNIVKTGKDLFILGHPGAGKTTLLKYIAILACKGKVSKTPVFISLKDWSDSSLSIVPFIARQFDRCGFPDAEPFVLALLDQGDALILLDGLDEVNELHSKRGQTIKEIVNISKKYKKCQFCLTCRTAATDYSFEKFKYLEVADFDSNQQIHFVTQWYGAESELLTRFLSGWNESQQDGLRDLGRTPLLLTLLCLAFEETLVFPLRQVDLYKEAIDALLRKWDTSRLIGRDEFYKKLSYTRREHLLELVASKFYFDSRTVFRKVELESVVLNFLSRLPDKEKSDDADAGTVIRQIEAQHGLIVERAVGIYSFSHLTLQEYFTAAHLVKSHDEKLLNQVVKLALQDQKWREVMLYTVGLLPSADTVLTKMASQLVELRGSDSGVHLFLGYCFCEASRSKKNESERKIGGRTISEIRESIDGKLASKTHPPLSFGETKLIGDHIRKIHNFLATREMKLEFGVAAAIVASADNLLSKHANIASKLLGGYFVDPEKFIAYLYACRLMIECLEVAVSTQRKQYLESIMSLTPLDILRL